MAKKRKHRVVSSATRERLRAMRERYGLGEYKKNSSIKRTTKTKRVSVMARRKRYSFRRSSRVVRYARSRSGKKGVSELALIGYAVVGENLFDQLTRNFNMGISPRILKIGAGYFLKKKSGLVGQLGTAMYTIELYKLGKDISTGGLNLGNLLGNSASASTSANLGNRATF